MTIDEAIKELKEDIELYIPLHGTIDDVDRELPDGRLITALGMAIKALEQEPCEDAISRQAVLEGLRTCYDTDTKEYSDGSQWINYEDAVAEMENLPSVTPQPKMGRWIRVDKDKCKCDKCEVISFIAMYPNGDINYCPNCGRRMEEPQESEETEAWNGIHAQITAPKGTFERIFNDADDDNDI